jgi:pyrimidine deaminase RibD-like protein
MFIDDAYAHLAALCRSGLGVSSPNPNVSAAIYSADGAFIADGIHNRTQSVDHAEVVALKKQAQLHAVQPWWSHLNHVRIPDQRRHAHKRLSMLELKKLFMQL